MSSSPRPSDHLTGTPIADSHWEKLYSLLYSRVTFWVRSSHVNTWRKQQDEIVEEIVQEAITRTFLYAQRADRGETRSIDSLEWVSATIAYRCFVDLWRRDRRLVLLFQNDNLSEDIVIKSEYHDPSELAINNVHLESLFVKLAHMIVMFPDKQRTALLVDLANRMHFDLAQPTPLQRAFLGVGIQLQDFQLPLPEDLVERARHATNLSLAYKRITNLFYLQQYTIVA